MTGGRILPAAVLLAVAFAVQLPAPACAAEPSSWCDDLLPVSAIADALPTVTSGLVRSATGVVAEDGRHCNRRYRIGTVPASDELILMVSPARSPAAARATIEGMARDASAAHYFGLSRPEGLGDAAVHYRRKDPLSQARMGFHVNFAVGARVIELAYHSVDDGERNKFVQASSEVVELARGLASRVAE